MARNDIFYANETPQMLEAFKKAQSTFKYFWRELYWERHRIVPALDLAIVKAVIFQDNPPEQPMAEFMWIDDIDFDGINVKGTLLNSPDEVTNIKQGDTVEIPFGEIADWLFATNGRTYGGFTIQAIRSGMDKKERKHHDKAWGLDFGDPDKILIAHEQDKHPENLTEHPMSINMKEKFKAFLSQHPEEISRKDESAYTMLHREAIAGNKTCVEILLQMGADINAKTDSGYTASDFAQKLEWEHLIPVL